MYILGLDAKEGRARLVKLKWDANCSVSSGLSQSWRQDLKSCNLKAKVPCRFSKQQAAAFIQEKPRQGENIASRKGIHKMRSDFFGCNVA